MHEHGKGNPNQQYIGKPGKTKIANCEFMGIHTKDFGETAYLQEELNRDVHWYTYLNELAQQENGVILSKNLAAALEVKVGMLWIVPDMGIP